MVNIPTYEEVLNDVQVSRIMMMLYDYFVQKTLYGAKWMAENDDWEHDLIVRIGELFDSQ